MLPARFCRLLTRLQHISTNVVQAGLDLLLHEVGGDDMYILDALGVLRRQGRGRRHGIAAMSGDDLLVGFEATLVTLALLLYRAALYWIIENRE